MLDLRDVCFRYGKKEKPVLSGASLSLKAGEIGILLGPNGAGKSTLMKIIMGLESPQSGTVLWNGVSLLKLSAAERARRTAYVPQQFSGGALSVFDFVLLGRLASFGFQPDKKDRAMAEKAIEEMGLSALSARSFDTLSGGEKQKAAIARALVREPDIILFDEPTGNLDIAGEQLFRAEVKRLAKEKHIAVLCTLHGLAGAYSLGDAFFFMKDGKTAYAGGKELFCSEVLSDIYKVRATVHRFENQIFIAMENENET